MAMLRRNPAATLKNISRQNPNPKPDPLTTSRPLPRLNTAHLNAQLTAYGRCGRLRDAQHLFDQMPHRDVVSWTALLTAYADNGRLATARRVFDGMPRRNAASWNAMLSAYIRASRLAHAHGLFLKMPAKNVVSYGAMISGFAKAGMLREAERVLDEMPKVWRDPVGSNALIAGYMRVGELDMAVGMFEEMAVRDVISWSMMVDGLCKYGSVSEAREVFEAMPERNVVSWTSMIRGYVKSGMCSDGLMLFLDMRTDGTELNTTTLSVVLDACAESGFVGEGIQIHSLIMSMGFESDVFLGDSVIKMYSRFGWMVDAKRAFDCMNRKDTVSWNSLITGYVQHNMIEEAHVLFELMPERDAVSWTSMVVGFANRGWMRESVELFERMPGKDEVAWTVVISGSVANSDYESALQWFRRMAQEGYKLNTVAFSCLLSALAGLAMLHQGMQAHAYAVKMDWEFDSTVHTSLVSMYAKCGSFADAHRMFLSISKPSLIAINSMITAFAQHGLAEEALTLFTKMQSNGHKPNQITFLGILTACARAGLVEEGYKYFESMRLVYDIEPQPNHYTCMVDLLGRAGLLHEALEIINSMTRAHSDVWAAFLSASTLHSNLEFAMLAAQRILELEPHNATAYTVLSNMFSSAGMNDDLEKLRAVQSSNSVRKTPGYSRIVLDNIPDQRVRGGYL